MKHDYIIVIDLEATCWVKKPPPGEQSEIIEIGICILDMATLTPDRKRSLLIKPMRSKVSEFCTDLTSITPEMVANGMTYKEACQVLEDAYESREHLWASWGDYDRRMLRWESREFNVPYPLTDEHLNLKQLYADLRNKGKRRGMVPALRQEEMEIEGRHHRGHDDAWNTARILAKLIKEDGISILKSYWGETQP